jgi:hypothetical protein
LADAVEFYEIIPEELLLGYLSDKSILTHKIDPDNSNIITKVSFIDGGKKLMRYLRQIDLDESNRITDLVLDIKKLDFNKNNLPGEEIEVETTDYDDEINSPVNATAKLDESIHSLVSMTNQKFKLAFLRDSLASSNGLLQIKNDSVAPDSKNNNGNVQNPYNI